MNVEKILLENSASPSRREFLKTSGMLVVGFSAPLSRGRLRRRQAHRPRAASIRIRTSASWIPGS
jgi:hypothetical protein